MNPPSDSETASSAIPNQVEPFLISALIDHLNFALSFSCGVSV